MFPVTLTGTRIAWRELDPADAATICQWKAIPEVLTYLPTDGPRTVRDCRDGITASVRASREATDRRDYTLGITLDGELVGTGGLTIRPGRFRCAELGYMLHPDHWGKGLATEAAELLLRFGFDVLGLHRIEAVTRPDNVASRRVLTKLGMMREGLRRQDVLLHGRWCDSLLFAVLDSDTRPGREPAAGQPPSRTQA